MEALEARLIVMAKRPVFFPSQNDMTLVEVKEAEFKWSPGLSQSQKKKSRRCDRNEESRSQRC